MRAAGHKLSRKSLAVTGASVSEVEIGVVHDRIALNGYFLFGRLDRRVVPDEEARHRFVMT